MTAARTSEPRWSIGPSAVALTCVAVVIVTFGLLLSRADLALLALPLIMTVAWSWDRRPQAGTPSTVTVEVAPRAGDAEIEFTLGVAVPERVDTVSLRLTRLDGSAGAPLQLVLDARAGHLVSGRVPVLHSGPQRLLQVDYRLLGTDGAYTSAPQGPLDVERVVPPPYAAIESLPLPRRLHGLAGTHDSSRPGDGGDFRDIHPFAPGDRLRRIDWRATARRGRFAGDLYVRRTAATADATVLIVIDSSDDVGERVAEWSTNRVTAKGISSLDLAREAASSIAAGYIRAGDRVGLHDLAGAHRSVAHGGGARHLWRLLRAIELTRPAVVRMERRRPPMVVPDALVYLISSYLDEQAAQLAALWRGAGHRVIAVDVLPAARLERIDRFEQLAYRIVMMERSNRLCALEARGVEVLRWATGGAAGTPQARLRQLCRPSRGRR
jgi:uncharacterized protein (DUF58 family)